MKDSTSKLNTLIDFIKSFHLYSRFEMSKMLKSALVYGEDFGDKTIFKRAKEDFLAHQQAYKAEQPSEAKKWLPETAPNQFGEILVFPEKESSETPDIALKMQVVGSNRKLEDFTGKDYLLDISPQSFHIVFPDLTFIVPLHVITETSWESLRAELQERGVLDTDIAHLSGEAVSLDDFRKKLKDTTSSDGELMELRKKMYALAYAINDSFRENISEYEK